LKRFWKNICIEAFYVVYYIKRKAIMTNREEWFLKAVEQLKQKVFGPHGYSIPKFRCGVGWPTGNRKKVGAQCFDSKNSGDKTYEIFVSPKFDEPYEIIEMLVHELCHAIAGIAAGHRKEFIAVMKAVGMVKPWTGSKAGDVLTPVLETVVNEIGPYPHAKLGQKDRIRSRLQGFLKSNVHSANTLLALLGNG